jgi:hypothetical protein
MPVPLGPWNITAGSQTGALTFNVDTGSLSGEIFGLNFVGFFNETSQTLTILSNPQLISEGGFADVLQTPLTVYQGSLFAFTAANGKAVSVLTGGFYTVTGTNALTYTTWFAQTPQPVKTSKEGKDGGKDQKDHKDVKEGKELKEKEGTLEKLPEFMVSAPSSVGSAESARATDARLATGRSFIEAGDRPAVGEAALQELRNG